MSRYSREEIHKLFEDNELIGLERKIIEQLLADQDRLCEYLDFLDRNLYTGSDQRAKLLEEIRG